MVLCAGLHENASRLAVVALETNLLNMAAIFSPLGLAGCAHASLKINGVARATDFEIKTRAFLL